MKLILVSSLLVGLIWLLLPSDSSADVIVVQDWITLNQTLQRQHRPHVKKRSSSEYTSPWGYLKHWSTHRYICPGGGSCPSENNQLWLGAQTAYNRNKFRFVQHSGHLGWVLHYSASLLPCFLASQCLLACACLDQLGCSSVLIKGAALFIFFKRWSEPLIFLRVGTSLL